MKPDVLLEMLEATAAAIAVKVSYEQIAYRSPEGSRGIAAAHGGLCRVKGQYRIIIDKRATPEERVATLAASLARLIAPEQRAEHPSKVQDALSYYSAA